MSRRFQLIAIFVLVGILGYFGLGNFVPPEHRGEESLWGDNSVRLGLDLRGGVHMVLSPDFDVALTNELENFRQPFDLELGDDGVDFSSRKPENEKIAFSIPEEPARANFEEVLESYENLTFLVSGNEVIFEMTEQWKEETKERAMVQALEVLRRRINDPATGIPESVVTRQGEDRILVQVPGVSRIPPEFIKQTGFLEFKIVREVAPTEELLKAKYETGLPDGTDIALETDNETGNVLGAYLVNQEAAITGALLADARVQFDNQRSEWTVTFSWNQEGGRIFGELTERNIGTPLAIILDGVVYSAPTIRSRISRSGEITGNFSSEEATALAVILRAGSLPIPVNLEEERTIGPALGKDSIDAGVRAAIMGLILIVAFIFGYYRLSGGYASLALSLNLVLLMGLMSIFQATLTLPGIAGLVLTVGMAVDANVIIFERIREELRDGKSPRAAIASGFAKSRWTILDANITTLITAIILYEYGTGPIKGFAVTLSVGILTSVFAALVLTRLMFSLYPGNRNVESMSI